MTTPGIEEEEALLGAILNHGAVFQEVVTLLPMGHMEFYKEEHRLIWRAIAATHEDGNLIDLVSVQARLRKEKVITRAGGPNYVSALLDIPADVGNAVTFAKAVNSASRGRELKRTARKMANDGVSPQRRIDMAYEDLAEINAKACYSKSISVGDVSSEIMSDIIDGNGFHGGIKTGFYGLDVPLNGLKNQDYIVLGARPSIGKSALALQIAMNAAEDGKRVFFVSPEMSNKQLTHRLMSMMSGVPYEKIVKRVDLKGEETDALVEANKRIKLLNIKIDDSSDQSVTNIRLKTRQYPNDAGLDLLIVDYLQLLCPEDDDKASVTKISKGLKAIAKDLHIPVLVCSQLRRRYGQEPRRPDPSRLRGSGQIEQDADQILLMHKVDRDNPKKIEVFIAKNRNGRLGQTMLDFDLDTTRFTEREGF